MKMTFSMYFLVQVHKVNQENQMERRSNASAAEGLTREVIGGQSGQLGRGQRKRLAVTTVSTGSKRMKTKGKSAGKKKKKKQKKSKKRK